MREGEKDALGKVGEFQEVTGSVTGEISRDGEHWSQMGKSEVRGKDRRKTLGPANVKSFLSLVNTLWKMAGDAFLSTHLHLRVPTRKYEQGSTLWWLGALVKQTERLSELQANHL